VLFTGCRDIDKLIAGKTAILFYGEAGIGKTTMLLTIASNVCKEIYPCIYISTEDTLHYERVARDPSRFENVFFEEIWEFEDLVEYVAKVLAFTPYKVLFIDSINSLYRLVAHKEEAISTYGFILGLIWRRTLDLEGYWFASAQVRAGYREEDEEIVASGMPILEYWFDPIFYMTYSDGERVVKVVKPKNSIERRYIVTEEGIEWIS